MRNCRLSRSSLFIRFLVQVGFPSESVTIGELDEGSLRRASLSLKSSQTSPACSCGAFVVVVVVVVLVVFVCIRPQRSPIAADAFKANNMRARA